MCSRPDTIIVSCGLANFEQSSWSTHRRHEFWGSHEELDTGGHRGRQRQVCSQFCEDNYFGMCDGRSIWMIDCRKFDDPDNDKSLRKHIGRIPRITKSIWISKNYHALHSRLYDGMHRFFSSKNIVIMICGSGRHRSVANAELWSNTLTRCSRHQHSVSLLHLSELDFWTIRVQENVRNAANESVRIFQTHYDRVQAECSRHAPVPDPLGGHWKRSRSGHAGKFCTTSQGLSRWR